MSPWLGTDATERVFMDRFAQLCTDQMFYVRKVCASQIGDFAAGITKQAFERVLVGIFFLHNKRI